MNSEQRFGQITLLLHLNSMRYILCIELHCYADVVYIGCRVLLERGCLCTRFTYCIILSFCGEWVHSTGRFPRTFPMYIQ